MCCRSFSRAVAAEVPLQPDFLRGWHTTVLFGYIWYFKEWKVSALLWASCRWKRNSSDHGHPRASGMAHHLGTFKKWLSQHPLKKVREGTRSCLWCSTLNVNFKNVDPPYPVISSAVQLNLGGQSIEGQQKVYTCTMARCQNRAPTRYTAFSQPHPFPHHMWAFRIDGKKMQSLPSPLPAMFFKAAWKQKNLEQSDGWACSLLQFSVLCLPTWRAEKLGWDKQPLIPPFASPGKVPFGLWREKLYGQLSLSTGPRLLFVAQRRKHAVA